ncbi:RNA polymerase sigma factor [Archangium violaceum]|uniref:RNA polymerase sigma factor n=1 Tax=Archangium violaceum TaxID=83451 RepID=UPI0036D7E8AA
MRMQGPPSQRLADLYRDYGPTLHRRARALTGDEEEATDIMQDAFLSFMRMGTSLRGEASPFTILYQIVTHRAVDRLRKNARWTGRLALHEVEEPEATERRLDMATAHEGGLNRVEAAQDLALLTQEEEPRVLTAAFLYFVEGHSAEQVGQILKLPRKAVEKMLKQFLKRARAKQARFGDEVSP